MSALSAYPGICVGYNVPISSDAMFFHLVHYITTEIKIWTDTSASSGPHVPSYSEASRLITKSVPDISTEDKDDAIGFAFWIECWILKFSADRPDAVDISVIGITIDPLPA